MKVKLKEDFLHYVWRFTKFNPRNLYTTDQQPLQILNPGIWNHHSGPDFKNGRIKIGSTTWAGNVEIHTKASDWNRHQHQSDPAYQNVILHVVYEADCDIRRDTGQLIPCLELKEYIDFNLLEKYDRLMQQDYWIPCGQQSRLVPEIIRKNWLDRLLIERLESKIEQVAKMHLQTKQHWEATFFKMLGRYFGGKVNNQSFELLVQSIPIKLLWKYSAKQKELEALLFGTAGLLESTKAEGDDYFTGLQQSYYFIHGIHQLAPLKTEIWQFGRMRPPNFPTIRIAQFAALVHQHPNLLSEVLQVENIGSLKALFTVQVSPYWDTHYVFGKASGHRNKTLGKGTIDSLLINAVLPFLYYYATQRANHTLMTRVLDWLEALPPEKNKIMEEWKRLEITPASAYDSQALLQLKQAYCNQKKCLNCAIGNSILS